MASGILSSQRAIGSTAGFAIMGSVFAATISIVLPGNLEPHIPIPRSAIRSSTGSSTTPIPTPLPA